MVPMSNCIRTNDHKCISHITKATYSCRILKKIISRLLKEFQFLLRSPPLQFLPIYIYNNYTNNLDPLDNPLQLPNDGYHQSKEEEEGNEFHRHGYNQFQQPNVAEINHSSCFQEGWLNSLNYAKTLGSNRLDNLQCTKNEVGTKEASPRLKQKKAKGGVSEVNRGRTVRSLGRKDKHSKVCTARGTRDRRVRLSPNTAIQFYDVQDRLGYDRPSKAIDWLMKEAKAAIDGIGDDLTCVNGFNHEYLDSNKTGEMGFFNRANGALLPSSSVFQNDCPRNSYNHGVSTSLQNWQNGTFLFTSGASSSLHNNQRGNEDLYINSLPVVKDPVQDLVQNQFEFTQQREPLQSSLFSPVQFSTLNVNYSNTGFSNEFLSSLQEQSSISRNPSSSSSRVNQLEFD